MCSKTENNTSTLCTKGCVETNMPLFKPNKHQPMPPPFHKEAKYSPLSNLCNLHGLIAVLHTKVFYISVLCQDVVLIFAEHLDCRYYIFQVSAEASVIVVLRSFLGYFSRNKCFCFELGLKQINSFVLVFWQPCQFIMYPLHKTDLAKSKTNKIFTGYFSTMLQQTVSVSQQYRIEEVKNRMKGHFKISKLFKLA